MPKQILPTLKRAAADWSDDRATRLAAALAYYTMLSIAPLLVISIKIVGLWYRNADDAQRNVTAYLQQFVGPQSATALQEMAQKAGQPSSGLMATVVSFVVLLFSAGGVFGELQDSMNVVWNVKPKPGRGYWQIIRQRFFSLTLVLGTAFVLLVSLVVNTMLASMVSSLGIGWFWSVVNLIVSVAVVACLFTLIIKYLPDAKVEWRAAVYGGILSAILFTIGRYLLAWYLGRGSTTSVYGAAGSLAALLIWTYYSALILFFGAEFSQALMLSEGQVVQPKEDAEKRTSVPQHAAPPHPVYPATRRRKPLVFGAVGLAAGAVLGGVGIWLAERTNGTAASKAAAKVRARRERLNRAKRELRTLVAQRPALRMLGLEKDIRDLDARFRKLTA